MKSLIAAILGKNNQDMASLVETGVDLTLLEDVCKDIPMVDTFIRLKNITSTVSYHLFSKKVISFYQATSRIDSSEVNSFLSKHDNSSLGLTVLATLEQLDEIPKATMLGKAFACLIKGEINKLKFNELMYIIKQFDSHIVDKFKPYIENSTVESDMSELLLINYNLIEIADSKVEMKNGFGFNLYKLSDYGLWFVNNIYNA